MILGNLFKIMIIDVDAKAKISYTKLKKRFELWRNLIGADTIEEIEALAKENQVIKDVVEEMKLFSKKKYVQDYTAKDRLIRSQINSAREEGQQENSLEVAKKMLLETDDLDFISRVTNLSLEKIIKLQKQK